MNILAHSYVKISGHFINIEVPVNSASIGGLHWVVFPVWKKETGHDYEEAFQPSGQTAPELQIFNVLDPTKEFITII